MKKWMIVSLSLLLVLSGCGKKPPAEPAKTPDNQQQQSGDVQKENDVQGQETPDKPDVDIQNMTGEDLSSMIEDFNSDDISPEDKEKLRVQLEEIFRQAEQQNAQ